MIVLEPASPFRLDLTVWALRRWPNNRVDRWDGRRYRRVLVPAGQPCGIGHSREETSRRFIPQGQPVEVAVA